MGQVLIRNIADDVLDRLKRRAAAEHKSLERSLREALDEMAKPNRAELLADLDRLRAQIGAQEPDCHYPSAEELIREDRDSR
jgi:plasmid stability protein